MEPNFLTKARTDPWLHTNTMAKMFKYMSCVFKYTQVGRSREGKVACSEWRAVRGMGLGVRKRWYPDPCHILAPRATLGKLP